jgi:hypothetical protein
MMAMKTTLLERLLAALVQEWGDTEVQNALLRLTTSTARDPDDLSEPEKRPPARKLRAIEQVERANLSPAQIPLLTELAQRFDQKQFLPSTADVREFLIMIGERPLSIKERSQAFRELLRALIKYSPQQLEQLVARSRHSGPSQLGPLSDAITSAAQSLPRHRVRDHS